MPACKRIPARAIPTKEALYVVEVNAGFAKKHGVKVGTAWSSKAYKKMSPAVQAEPILILGFPIAAAISRPSRRGD